MKKIAKILIIPITIILLVYLAKLTTSKYDKTYTQGINIVFNNLNDTSIINKQEVYNIIYKNFGDLKGTKIDSINTELIKLEILKHPYIDNIKVYKGLGATLVVEVSAKQPLLRVFSDDGSSFLIDKKGDILKLLPERSFNLLVVSGNMDCLTKNLIGKNIYHFKEEYDKCVLSLISAHQIALEIQKDEILKYLISQIWINSLNDIELIPMFGDFTVKFGSKQNIYQKLERLRILYSKVLPFIDLSIYKSVNIEVNNQLVFQKR